MVSCEVVGTRKTDVTDNEARRVELREKMEAQIGAVAPGRYLGFRVLWVAGGPTAAENYGAALEVDLGSYVATAPSSA